MRSGLVLYRLVFIKNAPVCAGAFFLRRELNTPVHKS